MPIRKPPFPERNFDLFFFLVADRGAATAGVVLCTDSRLRGYAAYRKESDPQSVDRWLPRALEVSRSP